MKNPSLHRYATRPGLYFTDDGGADAIVRSETADQVWFCVLEPLDQPSAFYADAVRLFNEPGLTFIDQAMKQRICTRRIPSLNLRETLFRMDGPNYGLWYVHVPQAWDGMQYGYRVNGPWDPDHGVSFNPYKLLLDPYAKGIEGSMELDPGAFSYECEIVNGKVKGSPFGPMSTIDSVGHVPVSVAIDDRATNKHDGEPSHPHVAWSKTVIYELHVKGFTANAPWLPQRASRHPMQVWHIRRRSPTCRIWASLPLSCCRFKPSNPNCFCRNADASTIGDIRRSAISRRKPHTPPSAPRRPVRPQYARKSSTWYEPCMRPDSK